jgi:hypothetical protein
VWRIFHWLLTYAPLSLMVARVRELNTHFRTSRHHTTDCCAVLAETLTGSNKHHKLYSITALKWITEQATNGKLRTV